MVIRILLRLFCAVGLHGDFIYKIRETPNGLMWTKYCPNCGGYWYDADIMPESLWVPYIPESLPD